MSNKRNINLKKYRISPGRYRELSGFCYQYQEWLEELKELTEESNIQSTDYGAVLGGGNNDSKVEKAAIRITELKHKINLVQNVADEVAGNMSMYIILAVTVPHMTERELILSKGMPCSRATFYRMRRKFFYILAKKKG